MTEEPTPEIYNEEQCFWANAKENAEASIKSYENAKKLAEATIEMCERKIEAEKPMDWKKKVKEYRSEDSNKG